VTSIAVTGASGFVGGHLRDEASRRGIAIRPLSRDMFSNRDAAHELRGVDVVVHLAARTTAPHSSSSGIEAAFEKDNVGLTARVAEAARMAGVRRFIFVSTAGVLGNASPPDGFVDGSPASPHNAYTRSKLAAEEILLGEFTSSMDLAILRPPLVYGPGAGGGFGVLLRAAASGWPLPAGAMRAPRSMMSVRNLSDLLLHVATGSDVGGLRLLVADAQTTSVVDLVRLIARAAGRRPRIVTVPMGLLATALRLVRRPEVLAGVSKPFVLNCSLVAKELGWTPPYRLEDEVMWSVAAMQAGGRCA
jgi:nucleoside-diphosphate-sugar epimerase